MSGDTILIVDDHPPTLRTLAMVLRDEGYEVVSAHGGSEAYELLSTHRPRLIISDVHMPSVDGFLLCGMLRGHPDLRSLPVILCTANRVSAQEWTLAGRLGVEALLLKPIPLADLLARVSGALAEPAKTRATGR